MILRAALWSMLVIGSANCCSIAIKPGVVRDPAGDLVKQADAIVRVTAVEYAKPPADLNTFTTGVPDSQVRFRVEEKIRGEVGGQVMLPGYLVPADDFNDREPPYNFVRPGGRAGSCYANSYRTGGQFLLFLKKKLDGEFTVNWYALGPVNEQLHSADDKWLLWVRGQVVYTRR